MVIDIKIRKEIEEKARLLEKRKEQAIDYVKKEIDSLIERLRTVEKGLIDEINSYTNIYGELLAGINSGNYLTDDEIKRILANDIPSDFGPSVDSFNHLRKEVESFRLWKDKKTKINPFDLIPKNIKISSTSCDSISICWDKVDCDCYYEVELESSSTQKIYQTQKQNILFTKLDSKKEYNIRVRTVPLEKYAKSIWSDPITLHTEYKLSNKYNCVWKVCPDDVEYKRKYYINVNNHRIATNTGYYCTIIGNTLLPTNKVTSWSIKILKSGNNVNGIYIGVAPSNINQNEYNSSKCGWYFDCYDSTLCSGPPHKYWNRKYGSIKENGKYVHTGDAVGVMMNTTEGVLSFVLGGVNIGVAFEGIPLDKPLVPCVILKNRGDTVELIF